MLKHYLIGGVPALLLFSGGKAQAEDLFRHFRLGATAALNIKADFGLAGSFAANGNVTSAVGDPNVDHVFDDGYVKVDQTGNAGGVTSFWGYNNAAQYNAAANTLTMHNTKGFDVAAGNVRADDSPNLGIDLAYGMDFLHWRQVYIGWEFGFGLMPIKISDRRALPATFRVGSTVYDTTSIEIVPGSGYQGGSSGVGASLDASGTAGADSTSPGTLTGSRTLDVSLYSFKLGPTIHWSFYPGWAVEGSLGVAAGMVSGHYEFQETVVLNNGTTSPNSGSFGADGTVFGAYANGLLLYHTKENADVFVGVQFMKLGDVNASQGGRTAELRLGQAIYLTAGINWPF